MLNMSARTTTQRKTKVDLCYCLEDGMNLPIFVSNFEGEIIILLIHLSLLD